MFNFLEYRKTDKNNKSYLRSHTVVWNNGAFDATQTDGKQLMVYLYTHISQARALASKAQGWETKSSYHSHTHSLTLRHTQTQLRPNTKGPLCSGCSQAAWPTITHRPVQMITVHSGSSKAQTNPFLWARWYRRTELKKKWDQMDNKKLLNTMMNRVQSNVNTFKSHC